jgi:F-type H+-transporting ATPase subunit a
MGSSKLIKQTWIWCLITVAAVVSTVCLPDVLIAAQAETAEEGAGEEHHYSILHFLFKIDFIEKWIPQPPRQPDLILNTYFMLILLVVFFIWATRKLSRLPVSGLQNFLEYAVGGLLDFFAGIIGPRGVKYLPFVCSFFVFILCLNLLGLIPGLQSPTADLNTTLALALVSIVGVQIIGIKENGLWGYLKHYMGEPIWLAPLQFPLHVIGELARVMSLSIRLFGNIFGEDTIIIALAALSPFFLIGRQEVPYIPFQFPMMLFGVFTSLVQALVFSVLTSIYAALMLEGHEEGHGEEHGEGSSVVHQEAH